MAWLQLHLHVDGERAEAVQDALEEAGACAVSLADAADQPLLEPPPGATPLWREIVMTGLFDADRDPDEVLAQLRALLPEVPPHRFETLADQAWERTWMADFRPMRFGGRLWIVPSWSEAPDPGGVNLRLDPGLAFGTGTHETTALCLEWLDGAALAEARVLDFGCGSGVLAIAALMLGAREAWACDIDPQALLATRTNAEHNGVADRLHCVLPGQLPGELVCDVVLANILAGPLVELAPALKARCAPGGSVVLSGILAGQEDEVRAAYADLCLAPTARKGDWLRISGRRGEADHDA